MVQQFCFTCLKYAHDNILGTGKTRRLLLFQLLTLVIFCAFIFSPELTNDYIRKALNIRRVLFFEWAVRIAICGVMIVFDSLLVLYFARVVRLYSRGIASARPTLPADFAVVVFVAVLCCGYFYLSMDTSLRLRIHMDQYIWIGRFFIQISNFFYIALEIGGAVLAWSFLKHLKRDKSPRSDGGVS